MALKKKLSDFSNALKRLEESIAEASKQSDPYRFTLSVRWKKCID